MPQLILKVIALHPMQRTAQLADRLDVALDEVDRQLRPHLVAGKVIEHEVIAPNGRPAMAYELSEQFKASEEGRDVLFAAGCARFPAVPTFAPKAAPAPTATTTPTAAPTTAPAAAPVAPAASDVPTPAGTKVDRAIACLVRHGTVATGQLRTVMGLRPGQHPSSYLTAALRDGRIKRDGEYWSVGTSQPATEPAAPPAVPAAPPAAKPDALASGATLGQRRADPPPGTDGDTASSMARVLTITLVEEPTFTAHVGEVKVPSLRVVSEWHGMQELVDPLGRTLIVDCPEQSGFVQAIDKLFSLDAPARTATVIKGHPDLVAALLPR